MFFDEFNKPFCFNADKVKAKQKKVYVCNGSDCTKRGTQFQLRRELEKYFRPEEIGTVNCIGLCQKNHAFRLDEENYSAANPESVKRIVVNAKRNSY